MQAGGGGRTKHPSIRSSKNPGPEVRVESGMEYEDQGGVQGDQNGTGEAERNRR